jgi:hypothetical protein
LTATAGLLILKWGGFWLIDDDPLPAQVNEAIVLQGSPLGENARIRGAVNLLRIEKASRMLLSVPKFSYWDQAVAPLAREYMLRHFGKEIADRVDFCETGPEVNSTAQESEVLVSCIQKSGWTSVAVVTSDYHTRRAGMIWRRRLRQAHLSVDLRMYGVNDPEFHAARWWSERVSAKTFFMESTKLAWTILDLP